MKIILLPGLDGTGDLFNPILKALPSNCSNHVISYPQNTEMNYQALADYVYKQLPKNEDYILIAESFSGPVAYLLALMKPEHLKSVIFFASFLRNPRPIALSLCKFLPMSILLSFPIPKVIVRLFLLGKSINKSTMSLFVNTLDKVPKRMMAFRLKELSQFHAQKRLNNMRTTYVQAINDKLVSSKSVRPFKELVENIIILKVEAPHFILQANSLVCAKIIMTELDYILETKK